MKLKSLFYSLLIASLTSTAYAQVKIGSNPGTIGATSNLEVEATNGNKTSVNKSTGQVTIVDGTQGAAKILTSDANGGASWQTLTQQNIPELTLVAQQASGTTTISPFNGSFNDLKDRIPLTGLAGTNPTYNGQFKQYSIPANGFYRVTAGASLLGTLPIGTTGTTGRLYLAPWNVLAEFSNINAGQGPSLSVTWEAYITGGTTIDPYVVSIGTAQNILVGSTYLTVTKLY